jgi:hypothetical protein
LLKDAQYFASAPETIMLNLGVERTSGNAKALGGAGYLAFFRFQHPLDVRALAASPEAKVLAVSRIMDGKECSASP